MVAVERKQIVYFYKNDLGEKVPLSVVETSDLSMSLQISKAEKEDILHEADKSSRKLYASVDGVVYLIPDQNF